MTTGGKEKGKNRSRYMNYPKRALDKLGKVVLGIDFVGPRYLKNNSAGVHFLSRKYIRPVQYGLIDRVEGQTTDEALRLLISDWKHHPLPEVIRMDNDPAFGEYNIHPRCIGRFAKVLLNLGVTPVYSAPRQPWNNGATEGYNSMFARKFWEQLQFNDEEEIDVAIHQFNMEYQGYNQLVGNNVGAGKVKDRVLSADFELPKEYQQGLRKNRSMKDLLVAHCTPGERTSESKGLRKHLSLRRRNRSTEVIYQSIHPQLIRYHKRHIVHNGRSRR